jgi:hypothetical protein
LLLGSSSPLTMTPIFYKVNYDPLRDFATTSMISIVPLVLSVHPSVLGRNRLRSDWCSPSMIIGGMPLHITGAVGA